MNFSFLHLEVLSFLWFKDLLFLTLVRSIRLTVVVTLRFSDGSQLSLSRYLGKLFQLGDAVSVVALLSPGTPVTLLVVFAHLGLVSVR